MKFKLTCILPVAIMAVAALSYHLAALGKQASAESENAFASAKRAVEEENYADAIDGYSSLIESGQHSAASYHNLAVAHHRSGDLGRAILNYERAAKLDPRASDIRANLERARKDSAILEAPAPGYERMANSLSPNAWSAIAASGLFALGLIAVGRAMRLLDWPSRAIRASATIAVAAVTLPAAALAVQHRASEGRAIVTSADTSLRVSPFDLAKTVTGLKPGKAIHILPEKHGDFHLAQLESGQKGWVKASEFENTNITAK